VYPNLPRTWRRQVREGRLVAAPPARFMPIRVAEAVPTAPATSPPNPARTAAETIEIALPDGLRVRIGNDVSLVALRRIMKVLRE
jgi:transposase